jgi:hypothetical protein
MCYTGFCSFGRSYFHFGGEQRKKKTETHIPSWRRQVTFYLITERNFSDGYFRPGILTCLEYFKSQDGGFHQLDSVSFPCEKIQ